MNKDILYNKKDRKILLLPGDGIGPDLHEKFREVAGVEGVSLRGGAAVVGRRGAGRRRAGLERGGRLERARVGLAWWFWW